MSAIHDRKLDALYARLPDVPCTGQCFTSCSYIGMSEAEHQRLKRAGFEIHMHMSPCPALDFAGRCSVHPLRPLICRLYGAVEALRCPWGCEPERWLEKDEVLEFVGEAEKLAGAHDAEGSAFVAAALNAIKRGERV